MKTHISAVGALLIVLHSTGCLGDSPIYALYGSKGQGSNAVVSFNVGIIPSGSASECQRQIDVFESAVKRTNATGQVELLPSRCVKELPPPFQDMVRDRPIPLAYVVKTYGNWAPIYTAWQNLPRSDPTATCKKLIEGMRINVKPDQAKMSCLPPK
jgi:hypothetical protein